MTAKLCSLIGIEFSNASDMKALFNFAEQGQLDAAMSREVPKLGVPGQSCRTNLFFGFFFDGTKNNYVKAEAPRNHSNVARLYDCYPGLSVPGVLPSETDWAYKPDKYSHFFKVYVPGVASPFKEVGDSGEKKDLLLGAATGWKGNERIVWALIQAINNVHRYFLKQPLVSSEEAQRLVNRLSLTKLARQSMDGAQLSDEEMQNQSLVAPRIEFEKLLRKLHANVSQHWHAEGATPKKIEPGIVDNIYISIFGFSRGATQARAFANWLRSLCQLDAVLAQRSGLSLGGFPVTFDFMGLFDTVASVGLGNTLGNNLLGKPFDGHQAWADADDSLRVSGDIPCLHIVAAHELRRSFPLDSISVGGLIGSNATEVVFPGVHSDIGCGYMPTEQGKGTDAYGADMLSRLPLVYMYKAARLAGVPLKLELASPTAQARFAVSPKTIADFNAYRAECTQVAGPLTAIMREQATLQMRWRLARRVQSSLPLHKTESFGRATNFDKNDLHSANLEFEIEIQHFEKWLTGKRKRSGFPKAQPPGFNNEHESEWEEIAGWWDTYQAPSQAVMRFFDEYVHDSRAWFKLIPGNPDNEAGVVEQLKMWQQKLAAAKRRFDASAADPDRANTVPGPPDYGMSDNARLAVEEYQELKGIPRYITQGREPFEASSDTWFLAARAGYLRFRKVYGGSDAALLSESIPCDAQAPIRMVSTAPAKPTVDA